MRPQVQALLDELQRVRTRWERLDGRTPDDRWSVRARPDAWSVAENVAHLNLTARAMRPLLDAATEEARGRGPLRGAMRRSGFGLVLSSMVGPVPRFLGMAFGRVRTPPAFVPTGDLPRAAIRAEFDGHLAAHEAALRAADGLALHEVRVPSPFVAGARYDAFSGWWVLLRHAHRHLDQAERVWGA